MATQLDLILQYAENQLGSSRWHGKCQAFVALCYEAGTGVFISCNSAKISRQRYMKSGTASDLYPPAGAAVYFNGDGEAGKKYGHVALSAGGGILYDPVSTVYKCRLTSSMHNGYLGWGWLGSRPEGATDASAQNTAENAASTAAGTSSSAKKEITTVLVKASSGQTGVRTGEFAAEIKARDKVNVFIQNGDAVYAPVVVDEVQLTYARDAASVLRFSVVEDGILQLENGCPVAFRYDGKPLFYGYVFEIKRKTGAATQVTCYDQLRYLQNKDSFVYQLSYSDLVRYVAQKYRMKTGEITDTGYVIPTRLEEAPVLDILATAAELTTVQTGGYYVLYDDFGKLSLRAVGSSSAEQVVDVSSAASFSVTHSIDRDVYNRVVVARDNDETGERELYAANDTANQEKWGILQYYERTDEIEEPTLLMQKAKELLKYYNLENKTLAVSGCIGDCSVRGGTAVTVRMPEAQQGVYMICEKAEHTFFANRHTMDLELSGGGDYV